MDICPRVNPPASPHKPIHELIIPLTPRSRLPQTQVELILQKVLVVRAAVQNHRQGSTRMDAGAQGVQHKLRDGNENAAHALIADSENLFAVRHDNDVNVLTLPKL